MKAEDIQDSKWKVPKEMVSQWGEIVRLRAALADCEENLKRCRKELEELRVVKCE